FYRHPGGTVSNKVHVNGMALDIRGDGGYVVGPGSVHPTGIVYSTSGNWSVPKEDLPVFPVEYFVQPSAVPPKRESAAEPTAALDETVRPELVERARAHLASCEPPVEGNGSDRYVFRVCCRLVGRSADDIGL